MRVLITGGQGFIGKHLRRELEPTHTLLSVDRRGQDSVDLLHPGAFNRQVHDFQPDAVIHLAAQVGRLFGEDDVRNSVRSNAEMTATVARVCADAGVRVMYASTSEVYGDRGEHVCVESDPLDVLPHNIYGLSKRWGEEVLRLYMPADQLTIMRFSMPYGTGVAPGRGRAALPNILWQAHNRMPIPIHRGAERSWCWIGDTVRAVRMLLEDHHWGVWNIGRDDDPRLLRDLAIMACAMTKAPLSLIEDVDPPPAQTIVKRLSTRKLEELGWTPSMNIHVGMARVLEWVRHFDADGRYVPLPNTQDRSAA